MELVVLLGRGGGGPRKGLPGRGRFRRRTREETTSES